MTNCCRRKGLRVSKRRSLANHHRLWRFLTNHVHLWRFISLRLRVAPDPRQLQRHVATMPPTCRGLVRPCRPRCEARHASQQRRWRLGLGTVDNCGPFSLAGKGKMSSESPSTRLETYWGEGFGWGIWHHGPHRESEGNCWGIECIASLSSSNSTHVGACGSARGPIWTTDTRQVHMMRLPPLSHTAQ